MADALAAIRVAVSLRIDEIEAGATSLRNGRGAHLGTLIVHAVTHFREAGDLYERELEQVPSDGIDEGVRASLRSLVAQKFERLGHQVQLAYQLLNTFSGSVGRADVPIGLQHLLGAVLSELVTRPADPIVHLNPVRMYSTKDLVDFLDDLVLPLRGVTRRDYLQPHPIVFNLPALDPSNALLSPIIAHEVAHSAVEQSLRDELRVRVDADVQDILNRHLLAHGIPTTGVTADQWTTAFRDWCSELICDAVALLTTGPAFALAFASFAQPEAVATVGTHPPVRDRYALHLRILEELGWQSVLETELSAVHGWLSEVGGQPLRLGSPVEAFLLEAMSRVAADIVAVARGHVADPLDPAATAVILPGLVRAVRDGIPTVEIDGLCASPWQIVLSGWIAGVDTSADPGEQLSIAAANEGLSELIIKSLELATIVRNWRAHERAGA